MRIHNVREEQPQNTSAQTEETTAVPESDSGHEDNKMPKDNGNIPDWMIILVSCFGAVIAVCGVVLVLLKKKK